MRLIFKITTAFALAIGTAMVLGGSAGEVTAQEKKAEPKPKPAAAATYSYTAQPGDSYSKMARKAVQTYGIIKKVNLSQAGIIFAETNLTLAAGSPSLELGQKVDITEGTVKEWVEKAKTLTAEQTNAWNKYVANVDFNTNRVGQSG